MQNEINFNLVKEQFCTWVNLYVLQNKKKCYNAYVYVGYRFLEVNQLFLVVFNKYSVWSPLKKYSGYDQLYRTR